MESDDRGLPDTKESEPSIQVRVMAEEICLHFKNLSDLRQKM